MMVKITEDEFSLIKRVAEIEFYELFGKEKTYAGERIVIKCILTPNDCDATICYVSGGFSHKLLCVLKDFKYCTLEFDNYIFELSLVSEDDMCPVEERMCFFEFRKAISYSMEEDERWWPPYIEGCFMRNLH